MEVRLTSLSPSLSLSLSTLGNRSKCTLGSRESLSSSTLAIPTLIANHFSPRQEGYYLSTSPEAPLLPPSPSLALFRLFSRAFALFFSPPPPPPPPRVPAAAEISRLDEVCKNISLAHLFTPSCLPVAAAQHLPAPRQRPPL